MGYLARLIAETGLGTTTIPGPSAVARLDVDVIRESVPTHATAATPAVGVPPDHRLAPSVETPIFEQAAERTISPPTPLIQRSAVPATPEPARTVEIERPAVMSTIERTGPSVDRARTAAGDIATVSHETAGRAGDPPSEAGATAAAGSEPLPLPLNVTLTHTPVPPAPVSGLVRDEGRWQPGGSTERDVPTRGPELQSIALSIGSIEVVVEGPPTPATPPLSSPRLAAPQLTEVDDLPRRLRRDYVTWPEGW